MSIQPWNESGRVWEDDHGLLDDEQVATCQRADVAEPRSPVPTRMISNGEYMPAPQTQEQRSVESRLDELAEQASRRLGITANRKTAFGFQKGIQRQPSEKRYPKTAFGIFQRQLSRFGIFGKATNKNGPSLLTISESMQEMVQKSLMSRVIPSEKIDVRSDIGEFVQETCPIPPLELPGVVVMEGTTEKKREAGASRWVVPACRVTPP